MNMLFQRYLLHGDLHPGQSARFFIQLQSSLENNRKGGPRPTDKDELDVHQLFFDLKHDFAGSDSFVLRSGRQELTYGSQRIISVREAPNVRQSFDGFRTMLRLGEMQVDGFAVKPVKTQPHVFDDGPDHTKALWGTYAVLPFPLFPEANIDVYYIGLFRRQASFDQGIARETRHSVGTRLWRAASPFDYNFEALYQWGSFGSGDVRAWTVASDTGYTFASLPFLPRIGLRADIASGDEDLASQDLQTFNPLFPKGAYFSQASLIGPANFFDLNPCLDLHLSEHLVLISDWDFFWRESTHDGLYNTAVVPVRSGRTSDARFIGSMPQVAVVMGYRPPRFVRSHLRPLPGRAVPQGNWGERRCGLHNRLVDLQVLIPLLKLGLLAEGDDVHYKEKPVEPAVRSQRTSAKMLKVEFVALGQGGTDSSIPRNQSLK